MADVTREGSRLIANWLQAVERADRCADELNRARCDASNAQAALGKWLLPSDAKPGEKIAVWEGDSLFQAELRGANDVVVTVRSRGKEFHQLKRVG